MKSKWIDSSQTKKVNLEEIAFYLANDVSLHPLLHVEFLNQLAELEFKRKICLLPTTRLQIYSNSIKSRIRARYEKIA